MNIDTSLADYLDSHQQDFIDMADKIWSHPEIRFEEFKSSKLQADYLEAQGFRIRWDVGGISTAFVAEWGGDGPIMGFAGEYDALPGLSQKSQVEQEAIEEGGHGHGCGHNLLGTGCLAAAVALKDWLERQNTHQNTPGTVRYFGCPAEEGGSGKVYMSRDGVFDDCAAIFNYHPGYVNYASKGSMLGTQRMRFRFHGKTAHAAAMPHMGRSALDAVELTNVGCNYLREHVPTSARIHYVIANGGLAANVVPDLAEVDYVARAHLPHEVAEVAERVRRVARGAAMMTETELEEIFESGSSCVLNNHELSDVQYEVMQQLGGIDFSGEEQHYAAQVNHNSPAGNSMFVGKFLGLSSDTVGQDLIGDVFPALDTGKVFPASSDVGDMSWKAPVSMLNTACWPLNVAAHTWGVVATGATGIGHKGMMYAAKVMATSAAALLKHPERLQAVRDEFDKATSETAYVSPIPDDKQAPSQPHPYRS